MFDFVSSKLKDFSMGTDLKCIVYFLREIITFLRQNVEKSNTSFHLRSLTKSFETIKPHLEDSPLDQSKRSKTSAHPVSELLTILLKAKKAKTLVITFLVLFFPSR